MNISDKYTPSQQLALYAGALMLLIAIPLKWFLTRYGINFCDEPLLILSAMDYSGSVLTPLSCYISGTLAKALGFSWIGFRYLSLVYFVLTLATACWYLWYKTRNLPLVSFVAGALSMLAAVWHNDWFNYFGHDTPSALMITVTLVLMLEYIEKPTLAKTLWLGLCTSAATLMRAPDIVMAPLVVLSMLYCGYRQKTIRKSLLHIAVYLAVLAAATVAVIILLYGSIDGYAGLLQGGGDSSHDLTRLVMPLLVESVYSVIYGTVLVAVFALFVSVEMIGNASVRRIAGVCAVIALAAALYFCALAATKLYIPAFSAVFFLCLYVFCKADASDRFKILVIMAFCVVSAAGSNTGAHKINYFVAAALVLIYYVPRRAALLTALTALVALIAFYTRETLFHGFFDRGVLEARTPVSVPFMDGLLTNEQQARYIESIDSIFGKYAADSTLCTVALSNSNSRYYFELVYDSRNPAGFANWSMADRFDDPQYVKASMEYIQAPRSKPMVVLYLREDGSYYMQPHFKPTLMVNALKEHLDSIDGNDLCTIFITR